MYVYGFPDLGLGFKLESLGLEASAFTCCGSLSAPVFCRVGEGIPFRILTLAFCALW